LACITAIALAGCAPAFQTTIINDTSATLAWIECEYPGGKKIRFRDVDPMRLKAFSSPKPRGDLRLRWQETAAEYFEAALPIERLQLTLQPRDKMLVLRIEEQPAAQIRAYGTTARGFSQSLLQPRGDIYPASRKQP
jgi:hypothetical protein